LGVGVCFKFWDRHKIRQVARDGIALSATIIDRATGRLGVDVDGVRLVLDAPRAVRGAGDVKLLHLPGVRWCLVYGARVQQVELDRPRPKPKLPRARMRRR